MGFGLDDMKIKPKDLFWDLQSDDSGVPNTSPLIISWSLETWFLLSGKLFGSHYYYFSILSNRILLLFSGLIQLHK